VLEAEGWVSAKERGWDGEVSAGERRATVTVGGIDKEGRAELASLELLRTDVGMSRDSSSEASNVDQETGSRRCG